MQGVRVNGTEIPAATIAAEAQNHPAADPQGAWNAAAEALAVRQLLLCEAQRLGISAPAMTDASGRQLAVEDALVEALLEQEVRTPTADAATCRRFYERHQDRFASPTLVEVAHILYAAPRDDAARYERALADARATIGELAQRPERFAELAAQRSACPSSKQGGNLGQIGPGQTVAEFEQALFGLESGQLCPEPVGTRFGAHVVKAGRRVEGQVLPFEAVADRIAAYLEEASWRRAVSQYIAILAGRGEVEGVTLSGADGPLVQ
jgi:peptidyl-prolyl cis-trans isomerase C